MTMFLTGARISQAIEMCPEHLDLANKRICIPGAKGMGDRWVEIIDLLVEDLQALPSPLYPRGWEHKPANARVFGYADRSSPRKHWDKAIEKAGIEHLSFHNAGRHGFGQEMNVRTPIDEKAASHFGGWSDISLMKRTYTHAEATAAKVHRAQQAGKARAEAKAKAKAGATKPIPEANSTSWGIGVESTQNSSATAPISEGEADRADSSRTGIVPGARVFVRNLL